MYYDLLKFSAICASFFGDDRHITVRRRSNGRTFSRGDINASGVSRTWYLFARVALKIQCARHCRDTDVGGKHCTLDVPWSGSFILCELIIAHNALRPHRMHYVVIYKRNRVKWMNRKQMLLIEIYFQFSLILLENMCLFNLKATLIKKLI